MSYQLALSGSSALRLLPPPRTSLVTFSMNDDPYARIDVCVPVA